MKAISIRQPWAWLIIAGHKDVENRSWATDYRGPLVIHAGQQMSDERAAAEQLCRTQHIDLPDTFERGGIIGIVTLVDCVEHSRSRWFEGPYGFVLSDPRPLKFVPYSGRLGLFDIPDQVLGETLLQSVPLAAAIAHELPGFVSGVAASLKKWLNS
jgi:hypothetical protein